jgi:hypothetical protein
MLPYEREFIVTTTGANQIVPLDYPGRCVLERIAVVAIGGGPIGITVYNRIFDGPLMPIQLITDAADGVHCQLIVNGLLTVKVGDIIAVTGMPVPGYNVSHRVTAILNGNTVVTDQTYTANSNGGNVQLAIPDTEWFLYTVLTLSGTGTAQVTPDEFYTNIDPVPNANTGIPRLIYFQFTNVGTYKIAIRSSLGQVGVT